MQSEQSLKVKAANIFFHKQVICQVTDQTWPNKETVWSDKKNSMWKSKIKNSTKQPISLL